jgi:hypothetical protein
MYITLPNALRRGEQRSFCIAVSTIALTVLPLITGFSVMLGYAAGAIVCACIVGLVFPRLIRIPYRIWNKSAKLFARFACMYLIIIAFHLVLRPAAILKSRWAHSKRKSTSSWVLKDPGSARTYETQYQMPDGLSVLAPWPLAFLSWAWRTADIPAMFLLPFLMMISFLQLEEEGSQISDIYTLF